jgi:hypothetical protein
MPIDPSILGFSNVWYESAQRHASTTVGFYKGSEYVYAHVPRSTYLGLIEAYSKGRYFHLWTRGRYSYRRSG